MACTAKYLTLIYGGEQLKRKRVCVQELDWDSGNLGSDRSLCIVKPQVLLNFSCKLLMDKRVNTLCIHDLGMRRGWTGRYKPQAAFPCSHTEVKGDTAVAGCCSGKGRWGPTCKKWACFGIAFLFTRASDGSSVHPAKRGQRLYKRAYSSLVIHCTLAQIVGGQLCTPCKQWQKWPMDLVFYSLLCHFSGWSWPETPLVSGQQGLPHFIPCSCTPSLPQMIAFIWLEDLSGSPNSSADPLPFTIPFPWMFIFLCSLATQHRLRILTTPVPTHGLLQRPEICDSRKAERGRSKHERCREHAGNLYQHSETAKLFSCRICHLHLTCT